MYEEKYNQMIHDIKIETLNYKLEKFYISDSFIYNALKKRVLLPNLYKDNIYNTEKIKGIIKKSLFEFLNESIYEQLKSNFPNIDYNKDKTLINFIYNDVNVVIIFKNKSKDSSYMNYNFKSFDNNYYIELSEDERTNDENKFTNYTVINMGYLSFIKKYFSNEFFYDISTKIDKLNDNIDDFLGYRIIDGCLGEEKIIFKETFIKNKILSNVDNEIIDNLFDKYKTVFKQNLADNILLMLGNKDYAESIFTSEWLYQNMKNEKQLEKTFIVAGYLKCIEQLLSNIVNIKGCGKDILSFDGTIKVQASKLGKINSSIQMLNYFIKENKILYLNYYLSKSIYDLIKQWKDKERNGYFHKDNITSIEIIDEIRTKTYLIITLILGSLTLTCDELNKMK